MARDDKSTYYDVGGIETLEIIKAKLTKEQFTGFCLGNILKYGSRLAHKHDDGGKRDSEKIKMYSTFLEEHLDNDTKPKNKR